MDFRQFPYSNLKIFLARFKIEQSKFEDDYIEWKEKNPNLEFNEFMWQYFQETAIRLAEEAKSASELYTSMRDIYNEMVWYRIRDERKKPDELLDSKHYYELMAAKSSGYKTKVIIIGRPDCKKCSNIQYCINLETELKRRTLPFKNCPMVKSGRYLACSCCYAFEMIRDKNDLPIKLKQ